MLGGGLRTYRAWGGCYLCWRPGLPARPRAPGCPTSCRRGPRTAAWGASPAVARAAAPTSPGRGWSPPRCPPWPAARSTSCCRTSPGKCNKNVRNIKVGKTPSWTEDKAINKNESLDLPALVMFSMQMSELSMCEMLQVEHGGSYQQKVLLDWPAVVMLSMQMSVLFWYCQYGKIFKLNRWQSYW